MFEQPYQEIKKMVEAERFANTPVGERIQLYTIQEWRADCKEAWQRIQNSKHWHGGVPCRDTLGCGRKSQEFNDG